MSLMVWLPLNGDIKNQGLSGISLNSSSTPVYDNSGKIGKCYSTSTFLYNDNFTELSEGIFSITYWVKYTSFPQYNEYCVSLNNSSSSDYMFMLGVQTTSGLLSVNASSSGTSLSLNKWYHVAYTYNGTTGTLYLDGTKIKTLTGLTCNKAATHLTINGRYGSRPLHSGSYLNDVRIYDHCLSAKEVKEISKGLICHLLLNGGEGGVNLIKGVAERTATSAGVVASGDNLTYDSSLLPLNSLIGRTFTFTYDYSVEGAKKNATGDYSKDRFGAHLTLTYKDSIGATKTAYPGVSYLEVSGTGRAVQTYTCSSSWTEITSLTIALQAYNQPASGNNNTWYIKNFKIEVGNADTGYSINPNTLGTSIKLTDCSGYGYHGIPSVLPPSYRKDTTRHNASYDFVGGKKVLISNLPTSGLANSYTISWWAKAWTISGLMFWGFSNGNRLNYYGGLYCNTGDGSSNPYQNNGTTITIPTTDVWHHYVMVGNGSTSLLYLDGNLYGTALTYKSITGSSIYLNGWDSSSSYNFNGYMSDFRIYATALSASDIKELYQIPISIDKSGNVFAMEFTEDQKPEFHKSGIIENSYIHENEADDSDTLKTFHIGKTKTFANQILEV